MNASIRRDTPADIESCHAVMWVSIVDLGMRHGTPITGSAEDWWAAGASLQRFLATHAAESWLAEEPDHGAVVGYARSIERGGLFELAEFFVSPGRQSDGVGKALLEHAFPMRRGEIRSIIATTDVRALSRYYRADTAARFPMWTLSGVPAATPSTGDLTPERIDAASDAHLRELRAIDVSVLEYPRNCESSPMWKAPPLPWRD